MAVCSLPGTIASLGSRRLDGRPCLSGLAGVATLNASGSRQILTAPYHGRRGPFHRSVLDQPLPMRRLAAHSTVGITRP